jgi:hypothetical protein
MQRKPKPGWSKARARAKAQRLLDSVPVDVETTANVTPEAANDWLVLATTISAEQCTDKEILHAYQEQNTPVEPGFQWIKNPAVNSPV